MSGRYSRDKTDVNYLYFVYLAEQIKAEKGLTEAHDLHILDYGCGDGVIVELLRDAGFDAYGVEVCYEGANFDAFRAHELYHKGLLKEIVPDAALPFPDGFFDLIISNMVFEHVEEKPATFSRLRRILKDDGTMQHHFPTREILREGHMAAPFVHWLKPGRLQTFIAETTHRLGGGFFREGKTPQAWAKFQLGWVDRYCFYIRSRDLRKLLASDYTIQNREMDYCLFRARNSRKLTLLLKIKPLHGLYQILFNRLAFTVIRLRKKRL